jgi:hypothetical protein
MIALYARAQSGVSLSFNNAGLSSLTYNGTSFLSYGDFRLNQVMFQNADGSTFWGSTSSTVTVDSVAQTQTRNYSWGSIVTNYAASGNRLNLTITVKNLASGTIQNIWINPLALHFPAAVQEYDGNTPLLQNTRGMPAVQSMSYGSGVMVLAGDDVASPLMLGFPWALDKPANATFPLTLNTGVISMYPNSYPNIVRRIPPGASDQYHISLRFGPPGSTNLTLASDVYQAFAAAFPPTLSWPDRRPIGQLILGTAATGWATNPRGWLLDPTVNVTTPAGVAGLKSRILAWANYSVSILQSMNAQGMITWDIEGERYPHATTYVCDPRVFEQVAPEMAGIADQYFQIFRDAGLRVGVCIRPQNFVVSPDGSTASQNPVTDPAQVTQLLIDKMTYARNRWGATLFYMDSNINSYTDPNPIDPSIMKSLQAAFPDSLVIPEHNLPQYFAYSAPYRQLNQGFTSTAPDVRAIYPASFTILYTPNWPIQQDFNTLVTSVQQGDTLMFRGWFDDEPDHQTIQSIYQAAVPVIQAFVSPRTWTMVAGQTQQFTAMVTGTPNQQVTWSVTPPLGTVSQAGVYTAPANVSSSQTVTVLATSAANATKPGSATVTINPAPSNTISATSGTPQSTTVNTNFGVALRATVKDSSNNPVSGATVKFTAPGSGASGLFGNSLTANVVTNGSGVAVAPALTANNQTGSYTVTASVAGVGTAASFSLTNTGAPIASVTATLGTPQSATVNTNFGVALRATVKDSSNNPVSGATVKFTAQGNGASALFGNSLTVNVVTDGNGVAVAPALTANNQTGSYTVTASVAGVGTAANFSLTNNGSTSVGSGGGNVGGGGSAMLQGSVNNSAAPVNLTSEGNIDWIQWGENIPNRKASGGSQLSDYSIVGGGTVFNYTSGPLSVTWNDGSPTAASNNNTNGVYVTRSGSGFSFTVPADTTPRTLVIHAGGVFSGPVLTASLSDGSAPNYTDSPGYLGGTYIRNYKIAYRANSDGQTLTVTWKVAVNVGGGSVSLTAAALQ